MQCKILSLTMSNNIIKVSTQTCIHCMLLLSKLKNMDGQDVDYNGKTMASIMLLCLFHMMMKLLGLDKKGNYEEETAG